MTKKKILPSRTIYTAGSVSNFDVVNIHEVEQDERELRQLITIKDVLKETISMAEQERDRLKKECEELEVENKKMKLKNEVLAQGNLELLRQWDTIIKKREHLKNGLKLEKFLLKLNGMENIKVVCLRDTLHPKDRGICTPVICGQTFRADLGGRVETCFRYAYMKSTNEIDHLQIRNEYQCPRCFQRLKHILMKEDPNGDKSYHRQFRKELNVDTEKFPPEDPYPIVHKVVNLK